MIFLIFLRVMSRTPEVINVLRGFSYNKNYHKILLIKYAHQESLDLLTLLLPYGAII